MVLLRYKQGMDWRNIIAELKPLHELLEKASPPLPEAPEVNASSPWDWYRTFVLDWEMRSSKRIDKACEQIASGGQCPALLPNELYIVMQRLETAIALARVLASPRARDMGWERLQSEEYPSFVATPAQDDPAAVKEWLLVCGWEYWGRSRWAEQMELHFLRKRADPEGTY